MQLTVPTSYVSQGFVRARVYSDTPAWQQALFVIWFFVLLIPIDDFRLIRYACLAANLALFARYYERTLPLLFRAWPLLLFPIVAFVSIAWSTYPGQARTEGVLLLLTPLILVLFAVRLSPREFLRLMMFAGVLMVAYFLLQSIPIRGVGAIMHKQMLAYHFLLISIAGLVVALNRDEAPIYRLIGLLLFPVAFGMQLEAESVTSLLLGVAAIVGIAGSRFVWVPMSRVEHLRSVLVILVAIVSTATLLVFVSSPQGDIVSDFLDYFGKDSTLTGRTMIWDAAASAAAEKPLAGHGLGGFWHPDVGRAQTIAELNHSAPGTKVTFHSVFWEVRVHQGWIGIPFIFIALIWAFSRTILTWIRNASFVNTGLLALSMITTATILTESYLAAPINIIVTTFYFSALTSFGFNAKRKLYRATPVPA